MQQLVTHPWITAGVALVGAGVIAVTPVTAPLPGVQVSDIALTSSETEMVLDFVRHGQSEDNVAGIIGTVAPGAPLTAVGAEQAAFLANPANPLHLAAPDSYDGIFASGLIRTQETAADWLSAAGAPSTPVTDLSGLNELNAGILEGIHQNELTGLLYIAAPLLWTYGQWWVPELGSSDYNGAAFESRFSDAVDTIFNNGGPTTGGELHDVAFSHAAAIMIWTMMNVKNPDPLLIVTDPLSNTGQVIIQGDPTDGWTLESWNGTAVPAASLGTALFVDFRDLITAPQMAAFNIQEGFLNTLGTGSLTPFLTALQTGIQDVVTAIVQFPQAVINSIIDALNPAAAAVDPSDLATAALTAF